MAHPRELAAEIEAAEKAIYGKRTAPKKVELPTETPEAEPVAAAPEPVEPPVETPATDPEPEVATTEPPDKPKRENWKKRYQNYKASNDATTNELRRRLVSVEEQLQSVIGERDDLAGRLAKANKVDPYKDLYTEEERDLIGDETISAFQKSTDAAVKASVQPLQEQLKRERELRKRESQRRVEEEREQLNRSFFDKLGDIVEDYDTIDRDKKFHEYMKEIDMDSGYTREVVMKRAQQMGDVRRVADFFLMYKEATKPVDKLAERVTPTGSPATPPQREPKVTNSGWTPAQIDGFYDAVYRGEFKGRLKEQQDIEKSINDYLFKTKMFTKKG